MDGASRPRLSLVIPAFNEEAGIRRAVAEADEALAGLADEYEIVVVDDGSTDATAALVGEESARRPALRLVRHETNRGYGASLRSGFEAARFERVAFTDADCQFHLADLALLLPLSASHPVVVGRRVDRQDPWRRRFLSRGYNLLARLLLGTGVRDVDCALKVYRREELARLLPESSGFFVNTEMLARARQLGLGVAEVGVRHRPRMHGSSSVSLREVPRTLGHLLPFWWGRVLFPGTGRPAIPRPAAVAGWRLSPPCWRRWPRCWSWPGCCSWAGWTPRCWSRRRPGTPRSPGKCSRRAGSWCPCCTASRTSTSRRCSTGW